MKKNFLYILSLVILSFGLSSCLFEDDVVGTELISGSFAGTSEVHLGNADKIDFMIEISEEGFNAAYDSLSNIFGQILTAQFSLRGGKQGQFPGEHAYQYQYSLVTDNYAGYFTLPQDFGGRMVSTYYDSHDFNGGPGGSFSEVKKPLVPLLNHPQIDSIPEIKAIALLLYNASAHEMADAYGPFPYADFKANKQSAPFTYNTVEMIYKTIVTNINTIVACLKHFENRPDWYKTKVYDILMFNDVSSNMMTQDMSEWVKYANSLKLRLAMHIVKVEPETAQKWAEEAVASGVIEIPEEEFKLEPMMIGFAHPLYVISNTWNDTRLNASLETILRCLNHGYLDFVFDKNGFDIVNYHDNTKFLPAKTRIVGLRTGIRMMPGQGYAVNFRAAYSVINKNVQYKPLHLMKLSEVQFLRAEGALRGWNMGGSAEHFYNLGVENAFYGDPYEAKYKETLNEYMSLETAKPYEYIDPYNDYYNMTSEVKIGVKWNNADDNETKLEKIITQKYIANFPNSHEAWVELRRTGYPKIFPVVHDDGDGSIEPGDIIRRIPFTGDSDPATKADIESSGIEALGGPDVQGTRLWWDVRKGNF